MDGCRDVDGGMFGEVDSRRRPLVNDLVGLGSLSPTRLSPQRAKAFGKRVQQWHVKSAGPAMERDGLKLQICMNMSFPLSNFHLLRVLNALSTLVPMLDPRAFYQTAMLKC